MPRKTKEINEEKTVKKAKSTTTAKAKTATVKTTKAKATKPSAKEKTPKAKVEKATPKKSTKSKTSEKTTKKTTTAEKKASSKSVEKVSKAAKKTTEKKSTVKKATAKKTTAKKDSTKKTAKGTTKTAKTAKPKTLAKTKSSKLAAPTIVEYYDLPYKYNQTVVKVLYQNPTTLFVYWEISDNDIENYKRTFGDNFFETTRPVLVVYNDTMNYHFEVDINDFANSWYFNINDNNCDYRVELIRRPVFYSEKTKTDKIYITSSNKIESPNDKILFSTDEPYTVYFKNTQNNNRRKVNLPKLLEELNLANKNFGFPIVRNVYDLYKNIYHIEDANEFSISLTNPSSGNPSSHSLSSRFI